MRKCLLLIFFLISCAEAKKVGITEFVLPAVSGFHSEPWNPAPLDDETVATVNGVKIPASAVIKLKKAHPEKEVAAILNDLISLELLAQEAYSKGYYTAGNEMTEALKTALAHAYLIKKFEEEFTLESIGDEELKKLWANINVRQFFNHPDWYSIQDMQWFCCERGSPACTSAEGINCFSEGEVAMREVYKLAKGMDFSNERFYENFNSIKEKFPKISLQEYTFFYDRSRLADRQKGYLIFDTPIYEAASKLGKGDLSPPVRSSYGWHILFVRDYKPEERRTLEDPGVVHELRKMFYEPFRKKQFMTFISELKKKYSVETFYDRLTPNSR